MKIVFAFLCLLNSAYAFGSTRVLIDGKLYQIQFSRAEPKDCPEKESTEFLAFKSKMGITYGVATSMDESLCKTSCSSGDEVCQTSCMSDPNVLKQRRIESTRPVLELFREYPSTFRSESCASFRAFCEEFCAEKNGIDERGCIIGCNQFDSFNR